MKIAIYGAITGGYELLNTPIFFDENVDYIMFTNDQLSSLSWKVKRLAPSGLTDRLTARSIKCLPHLYLPEYDYTIWVDSCFRQFKSVLPFLDLMSFEIAALKHPARNCIYEEAVVCSDMRLDRSDTIKAQMIKYKYEKYPENNGLNATGFLIRKNTPKVNAFNELWWKEVSTKSSRDQLSFNYCLWKLGIKHNNFNFDILSTHFDNMGHKKGRILF